jgi:hypothetical protein
MVVGVADEAQGTFARSSTAREILRVLRESVERVFRLADVVIPSSEHLSIGEVRPGNEQPVLIVYRVARLLWKIFLQFLEFSRSTRG